MCCCQHKLLHIQFSFEQITWTLTNKLLHTQVQKHIKIQTLTEIHTNKKSKIHVVFSKVNLLITVVTEQLYAVYFEQQSLTVQCLSFSLDYFSLNYLVSVLLV